MGAFVPVAYASPCPSFSTMGKPCLVVVAVQGAPPTAWHLTMHDTPQLNGVAEWLNWTLLECVCALQHKAGLPKMLWGEALRYATWLKNRTAMCALNAKMPFEVLFGTPPDLSVTHLWGCKAWVHNNTGSKLDACAHEGRWLGFNVDSRAHRVYWPHSMTVNVECNSILHRHISLRGRNYRSTPLAASRLLCQTPPQL